MSTVVVEMLRHQKGQDTDAKGVAKPVKKYLQGQRYEVHPGLAADLINMGAAKKVAGPDKVAGAPEKKNDSLSNESIEDARLASKEEVERVEAEDKARAEKEKKAKKKGK